ncbi:MAG: WYL domain-containing protein [Ruminococcaceae bacterium]|nr:WYL domain-containing protein [Oscillospiraceae bacterium]
MIHLSTCNVIYTTNDERHFTARVSVSVSEQFYAWLCGLGSKVKIVSPENVRDDFKAYLFKIQRLYD